MTPLPSALKVVQQTTDMIRALSELLPDSLIPNFRERLIAHLESGHADSEFLSKAKALLDVYEQQFGVTDFLEQLGRA